ncbi:MAG: hypothetical protein ACD_17C00167G0001, partial [uncultured bacterium]
LQVTQDVYFLCIGSVRIIHKRILNDYTAIFRPGRDPRETDIQLLGLSRSNQG